MILFVLYSPKLHTKYSENPNTDRIKKEGIIASNGNDLKTAFSRNTTINHKAAAVAHNLSPTACITGILLTKFLDNNQLMENNTRIVKVKNNNRPFKKLNDLILQSLAVHNMMLKNQIVTLEFSASQGYFGYNL